MDYKVIWSPSARLDLKEIVVYIAEDNPEIAERFGYSIIEASKSLSSFPQKGRCVPEFKGCPFREIIFSPYRIIYRISQTGIVEIVRIWHSARGKPQIN